MITLTVIAVVLLLLTSLAVLVGAAVRAPEGYEDEAGFHEGVEPQPATLFEAMVLDTTVLETGAYANASLVRANQGAPDHAHGTP